MSATRALLGGLGAAWRRPRLVVGIFLVDVLWTLAWTWPFGSGLARATDLRPYAGVLARGLHVDVLAEVLTHDPGVARAGWAGVSLGVIGWLVLGWFITAGVLGRLREPPEAATFRGFAADAAARGFAMARIQLLSVVPYAVAGLVVAGGGWLAGWIGSHAVNPWVMIALGCAGAAPGLLLWLVTASAVDVARVRAVLEDERRMWRVLLGAFRMVFKAPRRLVGVQVGAGVLWLTATLAYLALAWPFAYAAAAAFLLLTVMREILVLLRTGIRVGTLGAVLRLVHGPEPEAAVLGAPASVVGAG